MFWIQFLSEVLGITPWRIHHCMQVHVPCLRLEIVPLVILLNDHEIYVFNNFFHLLADQSYLAKVHEDLLQRAQKKCKKVNKSNFIVYLIR